MPKNIQEAERAVIAVLLTGEEYTEQILNECSAEMFADPDCRQIFLTAEKLAAEEMRVDLTTVHAHSEKGFAPKLVDISQTYSVPSNTESYIATVKEAWHFRTAGSRLRECLEKAQKHDMSCYADIDRLQDSLLDTVSEEERPVSALCGEALESVGKKESGLSTGFPSLDTLLGGGLLSGRLMILGGRPGMGKSALALNMALDAAGKGAVVLFVTLEMTANELTKRALYMLSGTGEKEAMQEGQKAMEKIRAAGETLSAMRFYIRDKGDSSLASVAGACRRVRTKEGRLDLVVIDYVGLMRAERTKTSTRQQEIAEISRGLKRLAIRMPTCVLLLSQLNRETEARDRHIPRLSDLRESGDLEQDADTVLFPLRPVVYGEKDTPENTAYLYVAKNRSGSPGRIDLEWNGPTYTFREKTPANSRPAAVSQGSLRAAQSFSG